MLFTNQKICLGMRKYPYVSSKNVHISSDYNHIDCRFPVQSVIRPHTLNDQDFRGFAGRIDGGVFKPGDEVISPSGFETRIKSIELGEKI